LFLDEIDASLDEDAREQLMKLITTVLIKQFGIKQVFWVSHFKQIQNNVPNTLKVIRKNKSAKARWA
jgi:DNA repair exonuclease SbcCD ATPase subunit